MRLFFLAVVALLSLAPMSGCLTLDMPHNRRHFRAFREEIRDLHQDIDKTIFGLDRYPVEE